MVLIAKTIIFMLKYKILDIRATLSSNGLKPKIPKVQKAQFFLGL